MAREEDSGASCVLKQPWNSFRQGIHGIRLCSQKQKCVLHQLKKCVASASSVPHRNIKALDVKALTAGEHDRAVHSASRLIAARVQHQLHLHLLTLPEPVCSNQLLLARRLLRLTYGSVYNAVKASSLAQHMDARPRLSSNCQQAVLTIYTSRWGAHHVASGICAEQDQLLLSDSFSLVEQYSICDLIWVSRLLAKSSLLMQPWEK